MKQTLWQEIKTAWKLRFGNLLKEWKAAWESTKDFIISFVTSLFGYAWTVIELVFNFIAGGIYDTGKIVLKWLIAKIIRM